MCMGVLKSQGGARMQVMVRAERGGVKSRAAVGVRGVVDGEGGGVGVGGG